MKQEIYINGDIGGESKVNLDFVKNQISPDATELVVYINSNGGEVDEGFAIYYFLKDFKGTVTTIAESYVYSIATICFLAGDIRLMKPYSKLMIHNPWGGVGGDADTIGSYYKMLKDTESQIIRFYNDKTGLGKDKISNLMKRETYMDAFEAQSLGFSTGIIDSIQKIAAKKNGKPIAILNKKINKEMNLTEKDKSWLTETFNNFFGKYSKEKEVEPIKNIFTIKGEDSETEMYVTGTIDELIDRRAYVVIDGEVTEELVPSGKYKITTAEGDVSITIDAEGVIIESVKDEVTEEVVNEVVEEEMSEVQILRAEMDELKESMKALMEDKEKTKAEMETVIKEKEAVEMKVKAIEDEKESILKEKEDMILEMKTIKNKVLGGEKPKNKYKDEVKPVTNDEWTNGFMSMLSSDNKTKLKNKLK